MMMMMMIIIIIQNFLHTLSAERSDAAAKRPAARGRSDYYIIIAIIIAIVIAIIIAIIIAVV